MSGEMMRFLLPWVLLCCGSLLWQGCGSSAPSPGARSSAQSGTWGEADIVSLWDLPGWKQCGPGSFFVTNGVATPQGGMGLWWFSGRTFTNFVLRLEFVQEQTAADSGVFLRFPDPGTDPWNAVKQGHEVEIGDPEPAPENPTWRTGSIYPFQASLRANTKPPGEWNTLEVVAVGHHYTVRINGEVVTTWTDPDQRSAAGYIGLQNYADGKTVRFRRLRLKDLPP
jgi:hypothetical protein